MYNRSHWLLTYSKFTFSCIVFLILTYKFLSCVRYRKNMCNVLVGKIKSLKICLLDFSYSFRVVWSQHLFKEYSLLIFDIGKQQWNHHHSKMVNTFFTLNSLHLLLCNPSVLLLHEEEFERCAYLLEAGEGFVKLILCDRHIVMSLRFPHYLKCYFSLSTFCLTISFLALMVLE